MLDFLSKEEYIKCAFLLINTCNMKSKTSSAQAVFDMLSFQYKPLENYLKKVSAKDDWELYQSFSVEKKIRCLDWVAQQINL